MGTKVVAAGFQLADAFLKARCPVKAAGKKERGFYLLPRQGIDNKGSPFTEFVTGKDKSDLFMRGVATDYRPLVPGKAPLRGGSFFARPSASFAASR